MRRRAGFALTLGAALGAMLAGAAAAADGPASGATLVGSFAWQMDHRAFGGVSAIEVQPDGQHFLALTDRGAFLSGRFRRDDDGRIEAIDADAPQGLRGRGKVRLPPSRSDSEGLAVTPDGGIYVSFEVAPRILGYDSPAGTPRYLPIPREFNRLRANAALEALAVAPDGSLYTLSEDSVLPTGAYPVYRYRAGRWDVPFTLPPDGDFRPVGADFDAEGRLYLLERSFGVTGFASRVKRFTLTDGGIDAGETLLDTPSGTHGNLEGLSVWRDAAGGLRLTMVADNNFHGFLPTVVVEYAIPD